MRYRGGQHQDEKRRIAKAAAALVTDGVASVALSGGTTTTEVARVLATMSGLKVVTNAINIASELALRPQIGLVVCGGSARPESHELVGPLAEQTLSRLNVDIAFVGVDGITAAAGLTTHHEVEAATNRAMIRIATRVVVVTDGSKLGRRSFAKIAGIDEIDDLITDVGADADECRRLEDANVRVVRRLNRDPQMCSGTLRASDSAGPCAATRSLHSAQISSTVSVAAVWGSSIAACRISRGSPSTAALTVSSTTLRNCRFSAAHCGGSAPTRSGCTPSRSTSAGTSTPAPRGQVVDEVVVGGRHLNPTQRSRRQTVHHLRRVLGGLGRRSRRTRPARVAPAMRRSPLRFCSEIPT